MYTENLERLKAFMVARQALRNNRRAGGPPPWTSDPILAAHRWCNLIREQDRTTKWIADNWRSPHQTDPDLWFAMLVARRGSNWV